MAGSSLLTLIDDIATVLDDIAVMSKVAAKKTTGVLGDDLALNANQVAGVRAERELPVVWAVAKGSAKNKLIMVPAAIAISALIPWAILPLLMIGGVYLCYEGFEKIIHKLLHSNTGADSEYAKERAALSDSTIDMVAFEKQKIQGAIRTDMILSAEIIVIVLGTVKDSTLLVQTATVSAVAALMTIGVYGLVAIIVKLDDAGLYLVNAQATNTWGNFRKAIGNGLLRLAPGLMKTLSIVGTIAMFMVGGGILVHGLSNAHDAIHHIETAAHAIPGVGALLDPIVPTVINTIAGMIAGGLALLMVKVSSAAYRFVTQ